MASRPFRVDIKEDVLTDLRERLKRTRWPDEIPGSEWDYGSNLAYVKELVDYWIKEFDWRKQEEVINGYSQYVDEVDGLDVHYIHERGKGPDPLPLLLIHGWPGSIVEFLDFIPLLTDPAAHGGDERDSFDVVAPLAAGVRVFGEAVASRDGRKRHGRCVCKADEPDRLRKLCGTGGRLGSVDIIQDGVQPLG